MSAIGSARRCCRGCGKERGPSRRRRRRRQQPCLSSCSNSCCCSDSASPAAFVSPTAASRPQVLQPWTEPACIQEGELRGAPASAEWPSAWARPLQRLRRRLGAGCSAIVTAAPERARKERGGNLFVQRLGYPIGTPQPSPFGRSGPWTPSGGGGRQFLFEIWEFLLPKAF